MYLRWADVVFTLDVIFWLTCYLYGLHLLLKAFISTEHIFRGFILIIDLMGLIILTTTCLAGLFSTAQVLNAMLMQ